MKTFLKYNYNLKNPIISRNKNIYVKDNNKIYLLQKVNNTDNNFKSDKTYYKVIKNRNNNYVSNYQNENYILIELDDKISMEDIVINDHKMVINNKIDWIELWKNKIDSIEKKYRDINNAEIIDSLDYYLGLSENALLFLIYNESKIKKTNKSICRKRINKNYRMPNNAIIDYKERDISEYIKYLYFNNKNIDEFLCKIDLKKYNKYLIYARLLFPTYYFDIVEEYLDNKNIDGKINKIIKKIDKYEVFLNRIYKKIFLEDNQIEWIKKVG